MTGAAQRSSVVLPILLAVIGVALLATAVMLVPVIIRTSVAQVSSTLPQTPAAMPTEPAPPPTIQPPIPEAPVDTAASTATPRVDASAAEPTGARRVKETLIESGVERYRVTVSGTQEDGARGLIVRAETTEDGR
jgi:hypothetical protein